MRELVLVCLLAASALQTGQFGAFTGPDDVGAPPLKGQVEFDPVTQQDKIKGTGGDDYGVVAAFPGSPPDGFTPIGEVVFGAGVEVLVDGRRIEVAQGGWRHL